MTSPRIFVTALALTSFLPAATVAGPYADELGKCLVESTSQRDRVDLVRWMFSAAALHPAVKPISAVTAEQLNEASKVTATLFMRLLTETCRAETKDALQYEGTSTIETAFSVLGQVAGREMFSSPEVAEGLALLEKYVDSEELEALAASE